MNAFQEAIKALLLKARDEGMSRKEAAAAFGMSYPAIVSNIKKFGIDWPHARWGDVAVNERDLVVIARHEAGETLEAIGADYGITRERVRQIIKKHGAPSKTAMRRAKLIDLAAFLRDHPMTLSEAVRALSLPSSAIKDAANLGGVEILKIPAAREAELKPLADLVAAGQSIYQASGYNHTLAGRLKTYCDRFGIKSRAPSRWSVSPKRGELVAELFSAGKSWPEIAKVVQVLEGTSHTSGAALYSWAVRHMDLPIKRRTPKPKTVREPKPLKIALVRPEKKPAEVALCETVRETAIVNRGKATASEIAAACGTTRNAVIGYWFRARQSGLVA